MLRDHIAAGSSLADAMRDQSDILDPLSIHMVEVGESSRTLDAVLDQLANFCERYQLRQLHEWRSMAPRWRHVLQLAP